MPLLCEAQRTPEWHAARAGKLTASLAAACLRLDPYTSPQKAFRTIVGTEPDHDNEFMTWGRQHEMDALLSYEAESGLFVAVTGFWVHPLHNWLGASPDGLVGTLGLVEVKCPQTLPTRVPVHHRIQALVQLAVTGRQWVDYFAWVPQGTFLRRISRPTGHGPSLDGLIKALRRFYETYVLTNTPPPRKTRKKSCPTHSTAPTTSTSSAVLPCASSD